MQRSQQSSRGRSSASACFQISTAASYSASSRVALALVLLPDPLQLPGAPAVTVQCSRRAAEVSATGLSGHSMERATCIQDRWHGAPGHEGTAQRQLTHAALEAAWTRCAPGPSSAV